MRDGPGGGSLRTMLTDTDELHYAGAARQAELLRSGALCAPELTELYLERIARLDGRLNAFRVVRAERAREDALTAQERLDACDAAPLLGVPIAVKDNMDLAGELTTHGTGLVVEPARADAEAVRRLRAAGAVIVGKTNLPELALWGHLTDSQTWGATRNPWDLERTPGGSSGGGAAAVAAGLAAVALASDGGGSIRIPAACCGLFGIKPQRGRVPLAPDDDHWLGLTSFGPIARSVADAALVVDVLSGSSAFARAARSAPRALRVAVSTKPALPAKPRPDVLAAVSSTAALLRELGHDVRERDPDYGELRPLILPRYTRGAWLDAQQLGGGRGLERRTRGMVRLGSAMGRAAARTRAKEVHRAERINALFDEHDVLMTPVTAAPPPLAVHVTGRGALRTFFGSTPYVCYTAVWNLTGQPAASVPAGFGGDGLPTAVQLVGRPDDEATVLALAAQIEAARPWAAARPPLG
jgi:amidase